MFVTVSEDLQQFITKITRTKTQGPNDDVLKMFFINQLLIVFKPN